MNDEELLAKLNEDAGSPEEAADLLPVIHKLQEWKASPPTVLETTQLTDFLSRILKARRNSTVAYRLYLGWLVLCSQLRVVQYEIWAASAIVMGLGTLVTLGYSISNATDVTLPFVLFAPVAAVAGIAFLYGPSVDPALEIELTTPVSPRQVLVARLVLVFGFDLIIGLVGSAVLSFLRTDISFWPLVSAWLAPMTFLSSLAFLMTTLTLDPSVSLLTCLGLWILENLTRLVPGIHVPFPIPDPTSTAIHPWLWLFAILLSGAALWLSGGEEHWLRKPA